MSLHRRRVGAVYERTGGRCQGRRCPSVRRRIHWVRRSRRARTRPASKTCSIPSSSPSWRGWSPARGRRCRRPSPSLGACGGIREALAGFFAPAPPDGPPLDEAAFLQLGPTALNARCNGLIESSQEQPAARAGAGRRELRRLLPDARADAGRGAGARGEGDVLPAGADARCRWPGTTSVARPSAAARASTRFACWRRSCSRSPASASPRRERAAVQEPRSARDPRHRGRVLAGARRGRDAPARRSCARTAWRARCSA